MSILAAATSQNVTIPFIPELYNPNFLDALLPVDPHAGPAKVEPELRHPMIDALKASREPSHLAFTENGSPAYASTLSPTLNAFQSLKPYVSGSNISYLFEKSWNEDPTDLTLHSRSSGT